MPFPKGGGVLGRVSEGAIQPEVAAVLGFSASWRNTSRLTGSTGLASKGRAKRATWLPTHLVRGIGTGHGDGRAPMYIPIHRGCYTEGRVFYCVDLSIIYFYCLLKDKLT